MMIEYLWMFCHKQENQSKFRNKMFNDTCTHFV